MDTKGKPRSSKSGSTAGEIPSGGVQNEDGKQITSSSGEETDSLKDVVAEEPKKQKCKDKRQPTMGKAKKSNLESDDSESEGKYLQLRTSDIGLIPEKIIGAFKHCGELFFLMKWKDVERVDIVPATLAKLRCLNLVVDFYEEKIVWPPCAESDQ